MKKKSRDFLTDYGATVKAGQWTELETFCLMVCKELLCSHGVPITSTNLKEMYNFVVKCNNTKNISMMINEKSTSTQVSQASTTCQNFGYAGTKKTEVPIGEMFRKNVVDQNI